MSELFIQIAVSLDNLIEGVDGDLEWFTSDTTFDDFATNTLRSIDGMIFGRKSHALLAQFWPTAGDAAPAEQTRLMHTLPKYVLTHGTETTGWANSHAIRVSDIAALKARSSRPIALFAGAAAAQAAIEHGLADELRIIRYPVLLGAGTSLFREDKQRRSLTLTDIERFPSGAALERYRFVR